MSTTNCQTEERRMNILPGILRKHGPSSFLRIYKVVVAEHRSAYPFFFTPALLRADISALIRNESASQNELGIYEVIK